jgi:hypothetical protein
MPPKGRLPMLLVCPLCRVLFTWRGYFRGNACYFCGVWGRGVAMFWVFLVLKCIYTFLFTGFFRDNVSFWIMGYFGIVFVYFFFISRLIKMGQKLIRVCEWKCMWVLLTFWRPIFVKYPSYRMFVCFLPDQ